EVSRFRGFEVSRFRGFEVSRFRGFEVSRFRGFEVSRFRGFEVLKFDTVLYSVKLFALDLPSFPALPKTFSPFLPFSPTIIFQSQYFNDSLTRLLAHSKLSITLQTS
ncbi:hypothetical protein CTT35_14990, partial [Photobacterium damselae]